MLLLKVILGKPIPEIDRRVHLMKILPSIVARNIFADENAPVAGGGALC
jgi:hypothetical protein